MLKKLFIALALTLPVMAFAQKFGTVDTDAIFKLMPERVAAEEQFTEFSNAYKAELQRLNEQMDKEYADFQALADTNPIKATRQRSLEDLQARIQHFYESAQREMDAKRTELMQPIYDRIDEAVKLVGTEQGFTIIFPVGAVNFTAPDVADCTELVKQALRL